MGLLTRPVLVLNKFWAPIRVTSLRRALILVTNTYPNGEFKANIIDDLQAYTWDEWILAQPADGEECIRGGSTVLRIPKIIQVKYEKIRNAHITYNRRAIYLRDKCCQYCGTQSGSFSIDHILPKSRGGRSDFLNCVLACMSCNKKKADRTPEEAGMKLRRPPFKPKHTLLKGDVILKEWEQFLNRE